jgi:hypothetical protein
MLETALGDRGERRGSRWRSMPSNIPGTPDPVRGRKGKGRGGGRGGGERKGRGGGERRGRGVGRRGMGEGEGGGR